MMYANDPEDEALELLVFGPDDYWYGERGPADVSADTALLNAIVTHITNADRIDGIEHTWWIIG